MDRMNRIVASLLSCMSLNLACDIIHDIGYFAYADCATIRILMVAQLVGCCPQTLLAFVCVGIALAGAAGLSLCEWGRWPPRAPPLAGAAPRQTTPQAVLVAFAHLVVHALPTNNVTFCLVGHAPPTSHMLPRSLQGPGTRVPGRGSWGPGGPHARVRGAQPRQAPS